MEGGFEREIEQASALLAIGPSTQIPIYRALYDLERWSDIRALFRKEIFDLHSIPASPQLISSLKAGLSVLKTPSCTRPLDANMNCPVCTPPYSAIAQDLPFSHHENSSIVCRITGEVMDENNPPLILPNGHVYSRLALERMAANLGGQVRCPRTGEAFPLESAKKVFIL
jgi:macrophage erythroblast attacher